MTAAVEESDAVSISLNQVNFLSSFYTTHHNTS